MIDSEEFELLYRFSLDLSFDEKDIHNRLLADLITGYFGKGGRSKENFVRWKIIVFWKTLTIWNGMDYLLLGNTIFSKTFFVLSMKGLYTT